MVPRGLEPRTFRLLAERSNQLNLTAVTLNSQLYACEVDLR